MTELEYETRETGTHYATEIFTKIAAILRSQLPIRECLVSAGYELIHLQAHDLPEQLRTKLADLLESLRRGSGPDGNVVASVNAMSEVEVTDAFSRIAEIGIGVGAISPDVKQLN